MERMKVQDSLGSGIQKLNHVFVNFKIDWLLTNNPDLCANNTTGPCIKNLTFGFEGSTGPADLEKGDDS